MNTKKINRIAARLIDNVIFVKILALLKRKYGKNAPAADSIKKILIIKLEGMGDSIYLLEIIHRLKTKYPDLKIDVLTTEKVPVFRIFGSSSGEFGIILINPLNLTDYCKTVKAVGKSGYDVIIDTTGMPVNIPLMLAFAKTSGTYVIGFDTLKIKKSIYDRLEELKGDRHIFENYISLFKIFSIPQAKEFTVSYDNTLDSRLRGNDGTAHDGNNSAIYKNDKPYMSFPRKRESRNIILVLSSNAGGLLHRKLPLANSVKLIKLLKEEFKDYSILLLGGPGDYDYLEEIKNAAESEYGTQNIKVEKTKTIKEAMVLLKNSFLNICIDSGLMHISSLANPNTYCLFGYSDPKNSLPFKNIGYFWSHSDCSPCSFYRISGCTDLKCMETINIEAVMDDIRRYKTKQ